MDLRFYLDPETGEPHIYNHGVTEDEVEDVLRTPGDRVRTVQVGRVLEWPSARPGPEDT
jgi:hypothetical protein